MRSLMVFLGGLALSAQVAFAAGSEDAEPPAPTPTTTVCPDGEVWVEDAKACVKAESEALNDDQRYRAVRELAYAGRYVSARLVLDRMPAASDAALTYRGFIARQQGDWPQALVFYRQAIGINPDNILARSYLGQGHVQRREIASAQEQLVEIRARNGSGTWAEAALVQALETGESFGY